MFVVLEELGAAGAEAEAEDAVPLLVPLLLPQPATASAIGSGAPTAPQRVTERDRVGINRIGHLVQSYSGPVKTFDPDDGATVQDRPPAQIL